HEIVIQTTGDPIVQQVSPRCPCPHRAFVMHITLTWCCRSVATKCGLAQRIDRNGWILVLDRKTRAYPDGAMAPSDVCPFFPVPLSSFVCD
ncbi:hypothetical protein KAX17_05985, partial [Candidatus Bipolaricaulota bacterium]|nr:hypothetical protein [Candidatus Bipolaricaulota bacterium]